MRLALAALLLTGTAHAQTVLARDGDWTAVFLPKTCAVGTETKDAALWFKAQAGRERPFGFLQVRKASWQDVPPGDITLQFNTGERMRSPYIIDRASLTVSFVNQWPAFMRTVDAMTTAREATISIGRDPMRVALNVPEPVVAAFRACIAERLPPET
ncbi:hypothetical protein [Roseicella sp. DB1501]|uniref:hypothetical protein n=1 Tax=Roseicella sp. DB1501 TaxID=2730925 RepID=UPI00149228E8|nr:hypothetical protein [Roseicella sp. DB1501]NOG70462.1 hypothetical protein [Roseicella sp. DB1501]